MATAADLVPMFKRELELCKVQPGETVAIYSEGGQRADYASAFAAAAGQLGARSYHVDLPSLTGRGKDEAGVPAEGTGLAGAPELVDAFKAADMVIDLALLLWTPEQHAIKEAGTRMLTCVEPVDVLARLFPTPDQRRRAEAEEAMLGEATRMHVTNAAGTDITYELGQYPSFCQYGYTDEPGRWDHFASTLAVTLGNEDGVNGVVVLQPGDVLTAFGRYVADPVRLTIRRNRITQVEGGFDAWLLEHYMRKFDDERAFAVSHIGWGLNEAARWDALAAGGGGMGMDARSANGSVMFAIGPDIEFGGTNDTHCHVDIPMRDCTLRLDDDLVIDDGRIVVDALQVGGFVGG